MSAVTYSCGVLGVLMMLGSAPQAPDSKKPPSSRPSAARADEALELTNGWALLAQGLAPQAAARAAKMLEAYPRSAAVLAFAVEADLTRAGAAAGLSLYERALGTRTLEEPLIVRRIAVAVLREQAQSSPDAAARLDALRALSSDGDPGATAQLRREADKGSEAQLRTLAAMGDANAVETLVKRLTNNSTNPITAIDALGDSGSETAVAPLTARLRDPNPEVRAAAAAALGKLGQQYDVVGQLRSVLSDQTAYVRVKAAGALYSLGDMSGAQLLQQLAVADAPVSRLMAAQGMAARPDAQWLELVRSLTSAGEPEIRVGAATLIAPHDPELARRVLEGAVNDPNPTIRQMAGESIIQASRGDLRALRYLLKSVRPLEQVHAAAQILALVK